MTSFSTTITYTDHWVVRLAGEIDVSSRSGLTSLVEMLSTCEEDVDLDLRGVTFIDSAGWASVRRAAASLNSFSRTARIVNPSPSVRHLTEAVALSARLVA